MAIGQGGSSGEIKAPTAVPPHIAAQLNQKYSDNVAVEANNRDLAQAPSNVQPFGSMKDG